MFDSRLGSKKSVTVKEAGGAQLAHRHVFGFKSGVKGSMHFTDDAHLLQLGSAELEFFSLGFDSLNSESLGFLQLLKTDRTANLD